MKAMIIEIQTKYKLPIQLKFSTPSEYVKAIKAEKIKYPVFTGDLLPYAEANNEVFTGYYSSKPSLKKQIKDSSALFHAHSKLFALKMLDSSVTDAEIG